MACQPIPILQVLREISWGSRHQTVWQYSDRPVTQTQSHHEKINFEMSQVAFLGQRHLTGNMRTEAAQEPIDCIASVL
jgi:hypothetical protein